MENNNILLLDYSKTKIRQKKKKIQDKAEEKALIICHDLCNLLLFIKCVS